MRFRSTCSRLLAAASAVCAVLTLSAPCKLKTSGLTWLSPGTLPQARTACAAQKDGQRASLFEMAEGAQKAKRKSKKTKKAKSSAKKKSAPSPTLLSGKEPLPKEAGDSWLPLQGLCVVLSFLPLQYPFEQIDLEKIFTSGSTFPLGLGVSIAGFLLCFVALLMVSPALEEKDARLVTTGPFALVRHPTYTGFLVLCTGPAVMILSPVRVLFVIALGVVLSYKLAEEEEALQKARPEEWERYSKKVSSKIVPLLY
eukprot:TRINITY_DN106345_c0_g1_i1.p1 TRINITY_DN106345_c0_g1~~TRINITY_DN106345_c0_g1_i1.p1  ORF type:complete len:265 (-),score=55.41 TRINITY_DN106345_c0_g1_i1:80-844(-)